MVEKDFVIVGAGLTGSTIARFLADHNQDVIILDRKDHPAGNVYDYRHECGAMVHKYGPHYFRCGSEKIWNFLNRFTAFYNWPATIRSKVDGACLNWPVTRDYIEKIAGKNWEKGLFKGDPSNFEEACLAKMPRQLYELFVKGYTEKQWGVKAASLDKELAVRITINKPNIQTLTPGYKWNALPRNGYTEMVRNMIDGIPLQLKTDYLQNRNTVVAKKMLVFTGPIDEFFDYKYGKLKYRGQNRHIEYLENTEQYQPCIQVNYPNIEDPRIRTIEWKHLMHPDEKDDVKGTLLTHETPFTPEDPVNFEYPFPDRENKQLYEQYKAESQKLHNVLICGRLGEYRYYDMDQAVGRAMKLAYEILERF
ncbi:FAD-dependent oxidoreductase [Parafilimonas sp.]|uniref:FAD-dependent oxidoreductase n=1 Tax=Parafilimonas sp. TaxID=1969739 RepID=UPI0039E23EB3